MYAGSGVLPPPDPICVLPPRHVPPLEAALTEQRAAVIHWLASNFSAEPPSAESAESIWLASWYERVDGWWIATSYRSELQSCLPALALHLAERFHSAWRSVSRGGGANWPPPVGSPPPVSYGPECEWVHQGASELELPDFPPVGPELEVHLEALGKALPLTPLFEWLLPPQLLRSLRKSQHQTREQQRGFRGRDAVAGGGPQESRLSSRQEHLLRVEEHPIGHPQHSKRAGAPLALQLAVGAGMGVGTSVGVALSIFGALFIWQSSRRRRLQIRRKGGHAMGA